MKRTILGFLLVAFALAAAPRDLAAYAIAEPSPSKIIDRYRKAIGGGALKRVRSTLLTGSVTAAGGSTGRFSYRASFPDRLRVDVETETFKTSECYNGKSAWRLDENGLKTLLGDEAKRLRLEALLAGGRFAELGRARIVPSPAVKTDVDGRAAHAIELSKDGVKIRFLFDSATHLLIKQVHETPQGPVEILFSDYRPVDGVKEPFSLRIKQGSRDLTVAIDRVVHNAEVVAEAFRYPATPGSKPLPELEPLIKAVVANQDRLEELRERYTFQSSELTRKLDGDGRVKSSETKVYQYTPVAGSIVRRLISVNGKELSPAEQEKEDKRVEKEILELLKEQQKEKDKKERRKARGESEKDDEDDDDQVTISAFLRISDITSIRREMFRGHEVIAFDFEPRKGYKPKDRVESLVCKLAGTMWVDEDAKQIARLEAHLTDSFKLGGGLLASIGSSTAFAFEQEKVDGELWMPSYGEANISVRLMLLAKFNRSLVVRYSDYRKYSIDSDFRVKNVRQ